MPKKPISIDRAYIESVAVPKDQQLTCISHKKVIDAIHQQIEQENLSVVKEIYRCNESAHILHGRVILDNNCFTAFYNSYEPNGKLKTCSGLYITGDDICIPFRKDNNRKRARKAQIDENLKIIELEFSDMKTQLSDTQLELDLLKNTTLDHNSFLLKLMKFYFDEKLIGNEQLSGIKEKYDECEKESFSYYNALVVIFKALENSHPKTWIEQHRMIYINILDEVLELTGIQLYTFDEEDVEHPDVISTDEETTINAEQTPNPTEEPEVDLDSLEPTYNTELESVSEEFGIVEEVVLEEEVIYEDDLSWDCLSCGKTQSAEDIFYEGQLCSDCANK